MSFRTERRSIAELAFVVIVIGITANVVASWILQSFPAERYPTYLASFAVMILSSTYFIFFIILRRATLTESMNFQLVRNVPKGKVASDLLSGYDGLWFAERALTELSSALPSFRQKLEEPWDGLVDPLPLDLMEFTILSFLEDRYRSGWLLRKGFDIRRYTEYEVAKKPTQVLTSNDLPQGLVEDNIFLRQVPRTYFHLCLPPGSMILRERVESQWFNPAGTIKIQNRYCTIRIGFQNKWQAFKLTDDNPARIADPSEYEDFQTYFFIIEFKATFSRWRSLLPTMDDYVEWAQDMLTALRECFDWETYVGKKQRTYLIEIRRALDKMLRDA
jgi:hypothetical protein